MTDLVSVASNAVTSYQLALGTISNNIANVATEGYSRQETVLQANPVAKIGSVFLGTGVAVDTVKRQYDAFVETNLRNSNSELASQEPMVNFANRVIDIMGSSSMGLSGAFDQFFNSARDLSSDPASTVLRGSFIRDSENMAGRFAELSSQLDLVQNETNDTVKNYVNSMNTLIKQLASVNGQLTKQKSVSMQPADLLDQRDVLLKNLSDYAHIKTFFSENGTVSVSLGPSFTRDVVVEGQNAFALGANFNAASPEKVSLVIDPYGTPKPLTSLSGGKLSGLMAFREQVLGSSRSALDTLANKFVDEVNATHKGGIDAYGNPGTDLFAIDASKVGAAGTVKLALNDAHRIAAAAQFRITEASKNTGGVDASILYTTPTFSGAANLPNVLVNNPIAAAAKTFSTSAVPGFTSVATIPNGINDVALYLGEHSPGQQLQVFTRDGRQLLGTTPLPPLNNTDFINEANGFASGASYSTAYMFGQTTDRYKDLQLFYGAKADVGVKTNWNTSEADPLKHTKLANTPIPAMLKGLRTQTGITHFDGNLLKINGESLGPLEAGSGTLQASDFASWIQGAGATGITATASNEIRLAPNQIDLRLPLSMKSGNQSSYTAISGSPWTQVQDLVEAIQASAPITGIDATLDELGYVVLSSVNGDDITIENTGTGNAIGLEPGAYGGSIAISKALISGQDTPVELTFQNGNPDDLAKLGFGTGAYIKGIPNEDLLVFVTGAGNAQISASYSGAPVDNKAALRSSPLEIKFTDATHFTITDVTTNTKLAERQLIDGQLEPAFVYEGLQVSFSSPPKTGDIFKIDGNKDGTGNNENMLRLIDLESDPVMGGGKTFAAAYIDHVNDMGNIARQAKIAQSALTVVHDQAVQARDQVSGVSLDQEAADLIRYQQAYQAAAKVLQVASQLFDSVLQVR